MWQFGSNDRKRNPTTSAVEKSSGGTNRERENSTLGVPGHPYGVDAWSAGTAVCLAWNMASDQGDGSPRAIAP